MDLKYKILTVIYHETEAHYNMAIQSLNGFPPGSDIVAIVNRKLGGKDYTDTLPNGSKIQYIDNDENCLAKAWNIGLKEIFKTHGYAVVSGLDSVAPPDADILRLISKADVSGFAAVTPQGIASHSLVEHGDGSFSFYAIKKDLFEDVGDFNEDFKPAYFEDNDYLERMWSKGYRPVCLDNAKYLHITQGTVKYGKESRKKYPQYMQKNLELFKRLYGKVPDHLPDNVKFN